MREVDISDQLLPQHHQVMRCLGLLGRLVDTDKWCLVGGMMVLVAARSSGRARSRAEGTKDGDVVVDVVTYPSLLTTVTDSLLSMGYTQPADMERDEDFARCTFVSGLAQVDVLAPDDTPPEQLDTANGLRSLAIPGGRRALRSAEMVRVVYAEDGEAELRVPSLVAAICVKAAAATDPRTKRYGHHAEDVAYLLTCIDDLDSARKELDDEDVALLRLAERSALGESAPWRPLGPPEWRAGRAALEFLIR